MMFFERNRHFFILAFILVLSTNLLFAQEILTANNFFKQVSDTYAAISDYEAEISVIAGKDTMEGTVVYKMPNLMRVDFSKPASQVIVYDGSVLTVYVPELRAILSQQSGTGASAAGLTGEGLRMIGRSYSIAYEKSPTAVPLPDLKEGEEEEVIRLTLSRLTVAEGFRKITLSINPTTLLIRRMDGTTLAGVNIRYDFKNIKTNQGILDTRFIYDSPASANMYNNFLFSTDE